MEVNTRVGARKLALKLLLRSRCRVKVAAVLSDDRGIFAWGWNHLGTDGRSGVHAEQHAVMRANPKRLNGACLTVAGRHGIQQKKNFVYARPCEDICMPLVEKYQIRKIEYLTNSRVWETIFVHL